MCCSRTFHPKATVQTRKAASLTTSAILLRARRAQEEEEEEEGSESPTQKHLLQGDIVEGFWGEFWGRQIFAYFVSMPRGLMKSSPGCRVGLQGQLEGGNGVVVYFSGREIFPQFLVGKITPTDRFGETKTAAY